MRDRGPVRHLLQPDSLATRGVAPSDDEVAVCCGETVGSIRARHPGDEGTLDESLVTCRRDRMTRGVLATCGTCGGEQRIFMPERGRAEAEMFAGLLDGSCALFAHRPGPEYLANRCQRCQAEGRDGRITCSLFGYDDDQQASGAPRPSGPPPLGPDRGGGEPVT